jgi:hypothetical protein
MPLYSAALALLLAATTPQADIKAIDGQWRYVEDRSEGKTLEQLGPPMSDTVVFKVEEGAVILVFGHGGNGNRNVKVSLDGTPTEVPGTNAGSLIRYKCSWKDGVFAYQMEFIDGAGQPPRHVIQRDFQMTKDGLIIRHLADAATKTYWVGLYKHPEDIPLATPIKATINDVAWIAGNWSGTRGTSNQIAFEERWTAPKGGSMLATSRTINRDRLSAFEFLRILEKDGGLVYVAQPNGAPPTEFVMTEFSAKKAVFENPRHDYPKKITYELTDAGMTATIGYLKGGTPRKFEFKRDGN